MTISARLRAENSMMRLIILLVSPRRNRSLRDANYGAALAHRDGCLPGPGHQNFNRSLIDAIANFGEGALGAHGRHGTHLRHEESDIHLCASDRFTAS